MRYWREHAAVSDRAVAAWPYRKLVLDASCGDWPSRRREICELLGLPADHAPAVPVAEFGRYAGTYRGVVNGKPREVVIAVKDSELLIQGLLWPENRLLPEGGTLFHAESWPLTLRFVDDDRAVVRAVTIEGRPLHWGAVAGTFEKVE